MIQKTIAMCSIFTIALNKLCWTGCRGIMRIGFDMKLWFSAAVQNLLIFLFVLFLLPQQRQKDIECNSGKNCDCKVYIRHSYSSCSFFWTHQLQLLFFQIGHKGV